MTRTPEKDQTSHEAGLFSIRPLGIFEETQYRGRFAPSPSGPLHFGSLIAAVASFCQAKSNNGVWLVRMEDIDPPREQVGADKSIIDCLEAHGLASDEAIVYQSQRVDVYAKAIQYLVEQSKVFYCSCTRKALRATLDGNAATTTVYPGTCRSEKVKMENCSTRLLVADVALSFNDAIYAHQSQALAKEVGDFVLQRRDDLFSYQLAVVIDDIAQGVTEVVRGVDLLDSTPRQMYLYQQFAQPAPNYVHLPLALMQDGKKLSKQTGAAGLNDANASDNLYKVLEFLQQNPPPELRQSEPQDILVWAIAHWDLAKIGTKSRVLS